MARRRKGQTFFSDDMSKWFLLGGRRRKSGMSMMEAMQTYNRYIYIDEAAEVSRSTYAALDNKIKMKTLTPQQEALLDADTKTFLQAGFLNDDLTPSDKGLDASEAIQFDANKTALLAKATAIIAAAKAIK